LQAAFGRLLFCPEGAMAEFEMETRGFEELAAKLENIGHEVAGPVAKKMVRAGARVMKRAIEERTPTLDAKTASSSALQPGAMKADIRIAYPANELIPTAIVGPGKKTAHVANWVEYGHREVHGGQSKVTAKGTTGSGVAGADVPAHPFVRPAFEAAQAETENAMVAELQAAELEGANA
jgi:HK97 gp10 family phage protein